MARCKMARCKMARCILHLQVLLVLDLNAVQWEDQWEECNNLWANRWVVQWEEDALQAVNHRWEWVVNLQWE